MKVYTLVLMVMVGYCFQSTLEFENISILCDRSSNVLVIDLGHVKITSDPEQERIVSTKVKLIK